MHLADAENRSSFIGKNTQRSSFNHPCQSCVGLDFVRNARPEVLRSYDVMKLNIYWVTSFYGTEPRLHNATRHAAPTNHSEFTSILPRMPGVVLLVIRAIWQSTRFSLVYGVGILPQSGKEREGRIKDCRAFIGKMGETWRQISTSYVWNVQVQATSSLQWIGIDARRWSSPTINEKLCTFI